jgi:D-sedoheptulose 7-phosphate isomerase
MTMDADATKEQARRYLHTTADTVRSVEEQCLDDVVSAAMLLVASLRSGGKLLICGNGGSAADAQHLATELVSTLTIDNLRPSISAIALTTDTSLLTAIANDFGVEGVFERQVESLGREGDVLIAISTSGSSLNVIRAAERARTQGLRVIALTGATGGDLAGSADVAVRVPSTVTSHIQECHLAVEQLLASLVEDALYPRSERAPAKGTPGSAERALSTTEEV